LLSVALKATRLISKQLVLSLDSLHVEYSLLCYVHFASYAYQNTSKDVTNAYQNTAKDVVNALTQYFKDVVNALTQYLKNITNAYQNTSKDVTNA